MAQSDRAWFRETTGVNMDRPEGSQLKFTMIDYLDLEPLRRAMEHMTALEHR